MCGIAGLISKTGRLSREALTRLGTAMADSIAYRGPDGAGVGASDDGYRGCRTGGSASSTPRRPE
jgi:asparagine synthetase B (glutamine-hydrolysing)